MFMDSLDFREAHALPKAPSLFVLFKDTQPDDLRALTS